MYLRYVADVDHSFKIGQPIAGGHGRATPNRAIGKTAPSLYSALNLPFVCTSERPRSFAGEMPMPAWLSQLWFDDQAQDVAEYAIMLAIAAVLVVGTVRLLGARANNVFSSVGSAIQ
jgi:Flp pilus assembly pilin Flp